MEKLVKESLYEYRSAEFQHPWETWKDAAKYLIDILKKDPKMTLDVLVRQCKGWVSHMSSESRNNFNHAVDQLKKMNEEELNEKFTEESDPVEDMGIGFKGIADFEKLLKEVEKIPNQDLKKMNFRDNAQRIVALREISGQLTMFYLSDKYGIHFKSEQGGYGGGDIGRANLGKWKILLRWSTTMQSIKMIIDGPGGHKESANCQGMRSLEASLINFCKQLNITLPKQ